MRNYLWKNFQICYTLQQGIICTWYTEQSSVNIDAVFYFPKYVSSKLDIYDADNISFVNLYSND